MECVGMFYSQHYEKKTSGSHKKFLIEKKNLKSTTSEFRVTFRQSLPIDILYGK